MIPTSDHLALILKTLLLCITATLFGLQHIREASRQIKKKRFEEHAFSFIGGIVTLLAVVLCVTRSSTDWAFALLGCSFICFNPIMNRATSSNLPLEQNWVRVQSAAPDSQFAAAGNMFIFLYAILHGRSSGLRWYHHAAHIVVSVSLVGGFVLL